MSLPLDATEIAGVCHEANRQMQRVLNSPGVKVAPAWADFGDERYGVVAGVEAAVKGATPPELHEAWWALKKAQGWSYGPVKSFQFLTHPCCVPYDELTEDHKIKDYLFFGIVKALTT